MGLTYFFYHILFHDLRLDLQVPEMDINKYIYRGLHLTLIKNNLIMGCATLILSQLPTTGCGYIVLALSLSLAMIRSE